MNPVTTTHQARPHHQTCVLIVDDEEDVRESLRDVVEMIGCSALTAASAEEALALLAVRQPCLMVVDLLMPGMTGAEMLETMSHKPELSSMPVIISTSAPERAPRGVPVLPKPIDVDALCGWMRRACQCA
jgi:CheY-like chemotaxis protein